MQLAINILLREVCRRIQVRYCHFGVSPVNCSDSEPVGGRGVQVMRQSF